MCREHWLLYSTITIVIYYIIVELSDIVFDSETYAAMKF